MASLTPCEIDELLEPYLPQCTQNLLEKLAIYLDLLLKWNARTNLTAIRDPREIVKRHFGESLFAAQHVGGVSTLLDYGSGAGFPGLPIALLRPEIAVTLAESQGKKASFLREVVRVLNVSVNVWAGRVDALQASRFECVTLRAVDGMMGALENAWSLAEKEIIVLTACSGESELTKGDGFEVAERVLLPCSEERLLLRYIRNNDLFHVEHAELE